KNQQVVQNIIKEIFFVKIKDFDVKTNDVEDLFRYSKNSFFSNNHLKCDDTLYIAYLWLAKVSTNSILKMTGHSPNIITDYLDFFE
ncbi:4695_t:CDS:1, partial [Dentiscutata erythropus]